MTVRTTALSLFLAVSLVLSVCCFGQDKKAPARSKPRATPALTPAHRAELINQANASIPESTGKTLSPYFFVLSDNPETDTLPLLSTRAEVTIAGIIADVTLTQVYTNNGKKTIEAIYIFPASTKAAIFGMKMVIGNRTIEAKINQRKEARQQYEQALREGRTASLLEQQRPNVFQMSVGNILPGDQIRVEMRYSERIVPEGGLYEFVLPTVVGPRYSVDSEATADDNDKWTQNPYGHQGENPLFTFGATVHLNGGMPIAKLACPSHSPEIQWLNNREVKVNLPDGNEGNRDFMVRYRLSGDKIDSGVLLSQNGDEKYFLAMIQPPAAVPPSKIVPREFIFILDVSGSMGGFPLDVSKKLMRNILNDLKPTDFFNILLFAGGASLFSEKSVSVTEASIQKAFTFIDAQEGGGGTELLPALKRALALPRTEGTSRIVTIATDGYVSVEKEAFELISSDLGKANFFSFGIGSSVNRMLIEGIARAGRGEPFVALNEAEAEKGAIRFQKYVSAPVLTEIQVSFDGLETHDVIPEHVPDLFAEKPVVVFGKFRGTPRGSIIIKGRSGDKEVEWRTSVGDPAAATAVSESPSLRYLWARDRIDVLNDLNTAQADDEIQAQITALGLKYNLLTDFTSFVAVDTVVRANGKKIIKVKQPLPMPAGVPDSAMGGMGYAGLSTLGVVGHGAGGGGGGSGSGYGRGAAGLGGRVVRPAVQFHSGKATVTGALSAEVIRRITHRHGNEIDFCYSKALAASPQLTGNLAVTFIIGADGSVQSATISSTTLSNPTMEQCVADAVKRWTFPRPEGGGNVKVTWPIDFSAKNPTGN